MHYNCKGNIGTNLLVRTADDHSFTFQHNIKTHGRESRPFKVESAHRNEPYPKLRNKQKMPALTQKQS